MASGKNEEIILRAFKPNDLKDVIQIMAYSFGNKFQSMSNLNPESIIGFLTDSGYVDSESFEGYWVAERNRKVVGVMVLKINNSVKPGSGKRPGYLGLCKKYGFLNVSKFLFGISILKEPVGKKDCYIDHIAVSPDSRGLGIGSRLLQKAYHYVDETAGLKRLTLFVAGTNTRAIKLYEKEGFRITLKQNSLLTGLIVKERIWYHMAKYTDSETYKEGKFKLRSDWFLALIGIVGFIRFPAIIAFFQGNAGILSLLNFLWFAWFLYLIPEREL